MADDAPHNIQAEQALLGALLANNRAYERVCDFLTPDHFHDPINGLIYERIAEQILDGRTCDAVTLKALFEGNGTLDEVGGVSYLAKLLASMVGITNSGEYGRAIYDTWLRRELIIVGDRIGVDAYGSAQDGVKQIENAERMLSDLVAGGRRGDRLVSLGDAVSAAIAQVQAMYSGAPSPAVMSGMKTVDLATGGFWPKNLILLAGIPGAGKTALAVQIAERVARRLFDQAIAMGASRVDAFRQPGVVLFSLEMSAEELGMRVAAYLSRIAVEKLMRGDIDMTTAVDLARAESAVQQLPMRIHDCRATSLKLLGTKMRMHLRRQPEVLGVVDHLLVLDGDGKNARNSGNDAQSVARASRDLKQLADDLNIPLLVLTHATRASATRTNPRPTQSDVKWAGEGDADVLFFVHRPSMFLDAEPPPMGPREGSEAYDKRVVKWYGERDRLKNIAEIVVAKRRMGPPGVWKMQWHGDTTSFSEFGEP